MMIKNQVEFEKALKTLTDNDRKTLEAFAHFLLVSSDSSLAQPAVKSVDSSDLLNKANNALLMGYKELNVEKIIFGDNLKNLNFFFEGREKPITFPSGWFNHSQNSNIVLTKNVKSLFVKFRHDTNRIDKVAFDSKLLTESGKALGKKRILALNSSTVQAQAVPVVPAPTQSTSSSQFVQKIIDAKTDGWVNTPAVAQISMPKSDRAFSKLDGFKEGRLRLSRVGEIMFSMLDQANSKKYVWDSEYFFGSPHDFTNVKTGKTYDIKCHFHSSERLQLSQNTLDKCDADYIVAVLVEEDATSYTATVTGYISKADFISGTKPWAYNEYVYLRSLELHLLNSPKDLF